MSEMGSAGLENAGTRIALLHFFAAPKIGGVETVLEGQAGVLARKGHPVRILSGARGESPGFSEGVERFFSPFFLPNPEDFDVDPPLAALLEATADCGALWVHNVGSMPFRPALTAALHRLAALKPGLQVLQWTHDVAADMPAFSERSWQSEPWVFATRPIPGAIQVAVSTRVRDRWCAVTGLPPDALRVVPNGIDPAELAGWTSEMCEVLDPASLFACDGVIFTPARLLRRKRIDFGLRVLEALAKSGGNYIYLITGAPDHYHPDSVRYANELLEFVEKSGLQDSVCFVGAKLPVAAPELRALYQTADLLLFPGLQEGFGIPLLEAGMFRLPVFCSRPARALPEKLEDAFRGLLHSFDLETPPDELAARMLEFLNTDPATVARREIRRSFSWESLYKKHLVPLILQHSIDANPSSHP